MRIQILLYDGFDELDALGPFEVLHAAVAAGAKLEVELARLDRATLTSARGLQLHVVGRLDPESPPALLVLPGGGWLSRATRGAWAEVERGRIAARALEFHRSGTILASVCTGAMFLASAGLLRDRPATTHRGARDDLEAAGARFVEARVVDDGDVITSGGITSGLDLALWIVERFAGPAVAHDVEHRIEYERRGTVWRRFRGEGQR
jgi:transcriptional regulator GlxA family with amidase domain